MHKNTDITGADFATGRLLLLRGWFFGLKFGSEMLYSNQRSGILILMNHWGHPTVDVHPLQLLFSRCVQVPYRLGTRIPGHIHCRQTRFQRTISL